MMVIDSMWHFVLAICINSLNNQQSIYHSALNFVCCQPFFVISAIHILCEIYNKSICSMFTYLSQFVQYALLFRRKYLTIVLLLLCSMITQFSLVRVCHVLNCAVM